jgi:hypothetical protein
MALTQGMQGFSGSVEALAGYLTVKLVTAAAGGVVGFAVGVVESIPEAAAELKKVIVNAREHVVSYTRYEYDTQGRIAFMRMYAPGDTPVELVRTEYFYSGIEALPSKTVVTSYPENKVRTIRTRRRQLVLCYSYTSMTTGQGRTHLLDPDVLLVKAAWKRHVSAVAAWFAASGKKTIIMTSD